MGKLLSLPLLVLSLGVGGCATTTPTVYKSHHSRAYNIAQAGGLSRTEDLAVPERDYHSLTKFSLATAGNTLLFSASPGLGLASLPALGLGLLTATIQPAGNAERDSIFGWLPAQKAGDQASAQKIFLKT